MEIVLKILTLIMPTGIFSPPPKEYPAEIRATTQEESTENHLRVLMEQFEFSS